MLLAIVVKAGRSRSPLLRPGIRIYWKPSQLSLGFSYPPPYCKTVSSEHLIKTMDPFFESQEKLIRVLYRNVQNTAEVRKLIFSASLPFTLIKPKLIVDPFQLSLAITKAQYNLKEEKMRTKSFQTEILYCLSPTKNISDSLKKFSAADEDTDVLLVGEENIFPTIKSSIQGDEIPMEELSVLTDVDAVKEIYQISTDELIKSSLLDSVCSRMASKEYAIH